MRKDEKEKLFKAALNDTINYGLYSSLYIKVLYGMVIGLYILSGIFGDFFQNFDENIKFAIGLIIFGLAFLFFIMGNIVIGEMTATEIEAILVIILTGNGLMLLGAWPLFFCLL